MLTIDVRDGLLADGAGFQVGQALLTAVGAAGDGLDFGEGDSGDEVIRAPGLADFGVELVDLFEGEALGLVDEAPDEEDADETAGGPDEEDAGLEAGVALAGVDEVGGGVGDGPVEEPVGGGGHGETLRTDLEGEELAGHDPGDGAPRAGEEEDVDADEGDEGIVGGLVADDFGGPLGFFDSTCDGDDVLADAHTDGTKEEEAAATPFLDKVETGESGGDVDNVGDDRDDEGVGEAGVLEVLGSVIENEVDTSQLLQTLEETASQQPLADSALEAVNITSLA